MENTIIFASILFILVVAFIFKMQYRKINYLEGKLGATETQVEFQKKENIELQSRIEKLNKNFSEGLKELSKTFFSKTNKHIFDVGFTLRNITILDVKLMENYDITKEIYKSLEYCLIGLGLKADVLTKYLYKDVGYLAKAKHSHWWKYRVWSVKDNCEIWLSERHLAYLFCLKNEDFMLLDSLSEPLEIPEDFDCKNVVFENDQYFYLTRKEISLSDVDVEEGFEKTEETSSDLDSNNPN